MNAQCHAVAISYHTFTLNYSLTASWPMFFGWNLHWTQFLLHKQFLLRTKLDLEKESKMLSSVQCKSTDLKICNLKYSQQIDWVPFSQQLARVCKSLKNLHTFEIRQFIPFTIHFINHDYRTIINKMRLTMKKLVNKSAWADKTNKEKNVLNWLIARQITLNWTKLSESISDIPSKLD